MTTAHLPASAPQAGLSSPASGVPAGPDSRKIERNIGIFLFGGVFVLTGALCEAFGLGRPEVAQIPTAIGAVLLAAPLLWRALCELRVGSPSSSSLVAVAILAAIATGQYAMAGFLAFVLLLAEQVVRRTAWGARHAIAQLVQLTPETARVLCADGSVRDAPLSAVAVGSLVRVRPGENLPVDGLVVEGASSVNQASLTGEAAPVEVGTGTAVYAGTTNLTGVIDLEVAGVGAETTIGKVSRLIDEAERSKTPRQMLIEQVAGFFVPAVLTVAMLVLYFQRELETAITVLVVATPSPLLLASPTAMVAAFAAAARMGVMIKETRCLEASANIDTVVLDKTGTLTTGVFTVSRLVPVDGAAGSALLQAAADVEQHSNHPLAVSILETAKKAQITPSPTSSHAAESHGLGVSAEVNGVEVCAGRAAWIKERAPHTAAAVDGVEARLEGRSAVHVLRGGSYLGAVGLEDALRPGAADLVSSVRRFGARFVAIFTGDRAAVAERVGSAVGVDAVRAQCLPEDKHAQLSELVGKGRRVLMVGDGINDGPSLALADVGIAMGLSGSDIATNSAGVALMTDELNRIPFLLGLARRTRVVVAQNIAASLVIAVVGLGLAASGRLPLWAAPVFQVVGGLFVLGNSFRLVRFGEGSTDSV